MLERKIWEFKSQTICTILGLTFDEKELVSVFKKLKLDQSRNAPYEMHGDLVQLCSTQNKASRQLDKLLKARFGQYEHDFKHIPQNEIYGYIENGNGNGNGNATMTGTVTGGINRIRGKNINKNKNGRNIPLSAFIWFAVRNKHEDIDEIEARVFATTHIFEHQASRFYDALRRSTTEGKPEDLLKNLSIALETSEKLQTKCDRLERKKKQLKADIETIQEDKSRINAALEVQKQLNRQLTSDLEKLGGEGTLNRITNMKKEINLLTSEVMCLTGQLLQKDQENCAIPDEESPATTISKQDPEVDTWDNVVDVDLNGMRVTYVGGVESLMPHYKDAVESIGGTFCYHCGRCIQGRKEIEGIVDKTDIIFCPVDINSHNACRYVKKACKIRDKPCYFLRSASLSMFIKGLEKHADETGVTA
ncbi:MAG: DUF2325 domain-containing protein [Methanosarcinales archaeon]|nr:MAG: DUF2325 domain-containing protein [Methanosarcinales archaeon]